MEPSGIEPLTPCVQGRCSPSWAMAPIFINGREDRIWTCDPLVPNQVHYQAVLLPVYIIGALDRNWTRNPLFRRQVLYPVELLAQIYKWCPGPESNRHGVWSPQDFKSCASTSFATRARFGGSNRTWTDDRRVAVFCLTNLAMEPSQSRLLVYYTMYFEIMQEVFRTFF